MLDSDLAELYGVPTKVFNQAVKRNKERFPSNFMFQLTGQELTSLRSQIVTSNSNRGGSRYLPYVFTEHGALMSANVLNSKRAIGVSILVVEAFVRLREIALSHKEIAAKLKELENRMDMNDQNVISIIQALRNHLRQPQPPPKRKIGFHEN